jgi:hypothetical protein
LKHYYPEISADEIEIIEILASDPVKVQTPEPEIIKSILSTD